MAGRYWLPNGGHLFFSPIAKVTGDDAMTQYNLTHNVARKLASISSVLLSSACAKCTTSYAWYSTEKMNIHAAARTSSSVH
ncbi:hypothetical protein FOVG_16621 [Fusarium oxysporum f. sp. pisi HDV247]|uniref:Uncharacterized protein n=1 Tax=Fusarium oxysporum f. sp. pisi HDV247 TaxID=1080344 RepID=W9NWK3_FUSOX|nr:hypothetical protein FOVG_16621 [Fusarium oxysporum f. sp. pisi HDV247]